MQVLYYIYQLLSWFVATALQAVIFRHAATDSISSHLQGGTFYNVSVNLWHLQIQDRLDIIQLALDTHATAYKDAAQLAMLAEQLGLSERHADIAMCQARAARRAGDLAASHELALQLARQDHAAAWSLAAEVNLSVSHTLIMGCMAQRCCRVADSFIHLTELQRSACIGVSGINDCAVN